MWRTIQDCILYGFLFVATVYLGVGVHNVLYSTSNALEKIVSELEKLNKSWEGKK